MSDIANTDLETLAALRLAAARLGVAAVHVAREVESGSARVLEQIAAAVSERAATLATAQKALAECSRSDNADCSSEANRVALGQERLDRARQAQERAQRAIYTHTGARQRYIRQIKQLTSEGSSKLTLLSGRVEDYLNRSGAVAAVGGGFLSSASSGAGGSGGSGAGGLTIRGAPDGFALMPIGLINTSDSNVTGPGNFTKGYSPEDLAWAHNALHEQVLPAIRAGKGVDYFRTKDAEANRYGSRSLSDTYSGFFGDSAIKLEPPGADGKYKVANGYHRVWVAQQMGLTHVVARLP